MEHFSLQRLPDYQPDFYDCWLDKTNTAVNMADFLAVDAYTSMQLTPISTRVNNPLHNDEACLADATL